MASPPLPLPFSELLRHYSEPADIDLLLGHANAEHLLSTLPSPESVSPYDWWAALKRLHDAGGNVDLRRLVRSALAYYPSNTALYEWAKSQAQSSKDDPWTRASAELLAEFSAADLRRVLSNMPNGAELISQLPGTSASQAEIAASVVGLVQRHGLLQPFFEAAIEARPRRSFELERLLDDLLTFEQVSPSGGESELKSVQLQNVRGFSFIDLGFPDRERDRGRWLFLLGENSTGKTTILQALALALSAPSVARALAEVLPKGGGLLRRGAELGVIAAQSGSAERSVTVFPNGRLSSESSAPLIPALFAYGCHRGSALGGASRAVDLEPAQGLMTLFTERSELVHAETWLKELRLAATDDPGGPDEAFYAGVLATMKKILPGVEDIAIKAREVTVSGPTIGEDVPLEALSNGYLSTAGWVLDLIARWAEAKRLRGETPGLNFNEEMTGLVLIDELDLYLHPRWQRRVVRDLRALFPKLDFCVTTHNPLTIQSARPGEVYVIARDPDHGHIAARQIDIPKGLRADQILTGAWFGLTSTLDDDTLGLLEEHRALLRAERSLEQEARRVELEQTLRDRLGRFAETGAEREAMSIAAELYSDRGEPTPEARAQVRADILARLKKRRG